MVDVAVHTEMKETTASASGSGNTYWLTFYSKGGSVSIFGGPEQAEALRMMADIFNDAFARKPQPAPAVKDSDSDDVPF